MSIRFVPAALVAVLVALVAVGGAALAFGQNSGGREADKQDLLERTASELGLSPDAVKDAHAQAQDELASERLLDLMDSLVSEGTITQEQADEAAAWFDAKPEALDTLLAGDIGGLIRIAGEFGPAIIIEGTHSLSGVPFSDEVLERMATILGVDVESLDQAIDDAQTGQSEDRRRDAIDALIAKLVEDGRLTEAEGGEITVWLGDMPEWLNDHNLVIPLLTGVFGHWNLEGGFDRRPFDFAPFRNRPGLERFILPDGDFEFPDFEFRRPGGDGSENHFFYNGPEGEFEFDGEVPEQFRDLFGELNGRFGGDSDIPFDLEELLQGMPFFDTFPFGEIPDFPEGSDVTTESIKGA